MGERHCPYPTMLRELRPAGFALIPGQRALPVVEFSETAMHGCGESYVGLEDFPHRVPHPGEADAPAIRPHCERSTTTCPFRSRSPSSPCGRMAAGHSMPATTTGRYSASAIRANDGHLGCVPAHWPLRIPRRNLGRRRVLVRLNYRIGKGPRAAQLGSLAAGSGIEKRPHQESRAPQRATVVAAGCW